MPQIENMSSCSAASMHVSGEDQLFEDLSPLTERDVFATGSLELALLEYDRASNRSVLRTADGIAMLAHA